MKFVIKMYINFQLIWLECPTNPLMKVVDITAISSTVKLINTKILVIVDNTFLTSYFQVFYLFILTFFKINLSNCKI